MSDADRYLKVVEWSTEDDRYVGSASGLILGGCHGADQLAVFQELCRIVEEAVELYKQDGRPLPPPSAGRGLAQQWMRVA